MYMYIYMCVGELCICIFTCVYYVFLHVCNMYIYMYVLCIFTCVYYVYLHVCGLLSELAV